MENSICKTGQSNAAQVWGEPVGAPGKPRVPPSWPLPVPEASLQSLGGAPQVSVKLSLYIYLALRQTGLLSSPWQDSRSSGFGPSGPPATDFSQGYSDSVCCSGFSLALPRLSLATPATHLSVATVVWTILLWLLNSDRFVAFLLPCTAELLLSILFTPYPQGLTRGSTCSGHSLNTCSMCEYMRRKHTGI